MGCSESGQNRADQLEFLSCVTRSTPGGISSADRESLIALHAALADRGDFTYLKIRSDHMASLQRGADIGTLTAIAATTEDVSPADRSADLCFIDPSHTNAAALQDARFCRQVIRDRGVIVFHDRTIVGNDIQQFLRELARYRAYPLAHELLVVEINVPTLLSDPRVRAQVPRAAWLVAERLRATRVALRLGAMLWLLRQAPRWDCRHPGRTASQQTPTTKASRSTGCVRRAAFRDLHLRQRHRSL